MKLSDDFSRYWDQKESKGGTGHFAFVFSFPWFSSTGRTIIRPRKRESTDSYISIVLLGRWWGNSIEGLDRVKGDGRAPQGAVKIEKWPLSAIRECHQGHVTKPPKLFALFFHFLFKFESCPHSTVKCKHLWLLYNIFSQRGLNGLYIEGLAFCCGRMIWLHARPLPPTPVSISWSGDTVERLDW